MMSFENLVAEAEAVSVAGWDFSWLDGRATEERPPWGYQRLAGERMSQAKKALDLQTGGGEVLAGMAALAPLTVATESWPPNIPRARQTLAPHGVTVIAGRGDPPFPFRENAFDLLVSRHPVRVWWQEIARVLAPGGTYLSQEIGPDSAFELVEFFRGPIPRDSRDPAHTRTMAEAAGLETRDLRTARLRMEFFDIGAVVYFLRKVIWMVPDFTVPKYEAKLRALHEKIIEEGPFIAHSTRVLIEARKPKDPEPPHPPADRHTARNVFETLPSPPRGGPFRTSGCGHRRPAWSAADPVPG